jgi:hypothetical protein
MTGELHKHPPWRHALELFHAAGFAPGDVVPHDWFREAFALAEPEASTSMTWQKFQELHQKLDLQFVANFEALRSELLTEHQLDLVNVRGQGYRIMPASEQVERALEDLQEYLRKVFRKAGARVVHVRFGELSHEKRQEAIEAQAKVSAVKKLALRTIRNPFTDDGPKKLAGK